MLLASGLFTWSRLYDDVKGIPQRLLALFFLPYTLWRWIHG
jgi:hypothetical protein